MSIRTDESQITKRDEFQITKRDESQITKRTCCKLSDWVSRCNSGSINYTEFDFQEVLERSSIVCERQFVKKLLAQDKKARHHACYCSRTYHLILVTIRLDFDRAYGTLITVKVAVKWLVTV